MNYNDGINHMLQLVGQRGSFQPFNGITINYPGKNRPGDYRLTLNRGIAPRHRDISRMLYNLIHDGRYTFDEMYDFLTDVYYNGTNTEYETAELEYLQNLIYWVTLQEEINYPRSSGKAGINLAFTRYIEAIYCTQPNCDFTIETIEIRCCNNGRVKPELYDLNNAPDFYRY